MNRNGVAAKLKRPFLLMCTLLATSAIATSFTEITAAADDGDAYLKDRSIGYVMTQKRWSMYRTPDGKVECPHGFNDGPREQFKILFPDDGTKRTLLETQLEREGEVWFPSLSEEPYPYFEIQGNVSFGLDLDGKVSANDFTSPDGEEGIDNELYRAIGCVAGYGAAVDPAIIQYENQMMQEDPFSRTLLELTNVDSLLNDDDVTVNVYRGLDRLPVSASGQTFMAGGSQRIDGRWGKQFRQTFHGKIVDGVLTTDAADAVFPQSVAFNSHGTHSIRDLRFRLTLMPDRAEGLMAGYADVESWYLQLNEGWATHHTSYGQVSQPSVYRALRRLADAHPDPETGDNTAISSSFSVEFVQTHIIHPPQKVAERDNDVQQRKTVSATTSPDTLQADATR